MKSDHQNPFDQLAELELNSGSKDDLFAETTISADLRFHEEELEIDNYVIRVGISCATLELELWGADITPGTRLNDRPKKAIETRQTEKRVNTAKRGISGQASGSTGGVTLEGRGSIFGSKELSREQTQELSSDWTTDFVSCRPGKRWAICDPSDISKQDFLTGTFIANERLCEISRKKNANNVEVSAKIVVRRRDLVIQPEGNSIQKELRKLTHQEKFIKAIIARAIVEGTTQQSFEAQYGQFVIARSRLSGENDDEHQ